MRVSLASIWRSEGATQGQGSRLTKGVRLKRGQRQGQIGAGWDRAWRVEGGGRHKKASQALHEYTALI